MKKFFKKNLEFFIVFGLVSLFCIFYLWDTIIITIYPGHAGVLFKRFFNQGTVIEKSYDEGLHIILPWNKMYVYDVRIQEHKQQVEVLSQNGLTIKVVVSVRYFLLKDEIPLLHQRVGTEFRDKVILPSTISSVREVIGKYLPEQLYTTARHIIQDEILVGTIEETGRLPIVYSDMIIETIKLPPMINAAIETKLRHQQEYLEYQYKILMAKAEKERKIIEAAGIKQYQLIISESLSPPLLTWQGIQATKDIATSTNSKIIVIGGKDGLPIILNTEDSCGNPVQPDLPIPQKELPPLPAPSPDREKAPELPGKDLSSNRQQKQDKDVLKDLNEKDLNKKDLTNLWDAINTFNKKFNPNSFEYRNPDHSVQPKK
jgi:regulator of protease activity HflC (stomatin/prohibitin superfamily)